MIRIYVFLIFCLILTLVFLENRRELHSYVTVNYCIHSDKLTSGTSFHFVFLSDLHNHQYGIDNSELLNEIASLKPDFILIGGDMITRSDSHSYELTFPLLKKLPDIAPVFYTNGNHEQKLRFFQDDYDLLYDDLIKHLKVSGIPLLQNETVSFPVDKNELSFTGLEIPVECYSFFHKKSCTSKDIQERIGIPKEEDHFKILLAHNPMYMKEYMNFHYDLILSGHLHGGILRLPFLGGVIAPDFRPFPKYSGGLYQEKDTIIVVSNGLGTHSVPIRINCPAQLIHITVENT